MASIPLVVWACGQDGCRAAGPPTSPAFAVRVVDPGDGDGLLASLRRLQPQVVVLDADWCRGAMQMRLKQLRSAAPLAEWIVCWRDATSDAVEVLLELGALAAIGRDAPVAAWEQAVRAVLEGQIWLPRDSERWLYLKAQAAQRRDPERDGAATLTAREAEVHSLLEQGLTNKQIAKRLDISPNTVKKHVAAVFEKAGMRSRRQAVFLGDGA